MLAALRNVAGRFALREETRWSFAGRLPPEPRSPGFLLPIGIVLIGIGIGVELLWGSI